jgi:hypothetical protein
LVSIPKFEIPKIEIVPKVDVKKESPKEDLPKITLPKIEKIVIPEVKKDVPPKTEAVKEIPKVDLPKIPKIAKADIPKAEIKEYKKLSTDVQKVSVKIPKDKDSGASPLDLSDDEEISIAIHVGILIDLPGFAKMGYISPSKEDIIPVAKQCAAVCKARGWSIEKFYKSAYLDIILLTMGYLGIAAGMRMNYEKHQADIRHNRKVQDKIKETSNIGGKSDISVAEKKIETEVIKEKAVVTPTAEVKATNGPLSPIGA